MQVDVLGSTGSQPGGGQACSGYLVSSDTSMVLVDCGFGVATRLTGLVDPERLDAIVVTHRHLDHSIDLLGLFRVLWSTDGSVPVFAAEEVQETLLPMVKEGRRAEWDRIFPWTVVGPGDRWSVGDLEVVAHDSDHPVPTVSLRLVDPAGSTLAYSSDSGGGGDLVACAARADLFLAEATWQGRDGDRRGDGHMTAIRAGSVAATAHVKRLVLTHLRAHLDPATSVREATTTFDGPVDVARDGDRFAC